MLFAGDQDFICNYMGQEALIKAMTWNGGTGLGVRSMTKLLNSEQLKHADMTSRPSKLRRGP
jgi:carboxypeptidase C (cathepsin A)